MKSLFNGVIGVSLVVILVQPANANRSSTAQRIGSQKITTFAVLDHLKEAQIKSPYVPSKRALFHKVHATNKLMGTTHQNPWGGDGKYANMHVTSISIHVAILTYNPYSKFVLIHLNLLT